MLKESKAFSSFSVDNLEKAKKFYGSILGLEIKDNPMGVLELHIEGSSPVIIYLKPDHQAGAFTVLNFPVQSVENAVTELEEKGIHFEHYNDEHLRTDGRGIFRGDGPVIAWFKDPAGNILSIVETI